MKKHTIALAIGRAACVVQIGFITYGYLMGRRIDKQRRQLEEKWREQIALYLDDPDLIDKDGLKECLDGLEKKYPALFPPLEDEVKIGTALHQSIEQMQDEEMSDDEKAGWAAADRDFNERMIRDLEDDRTCPECGAKPTFVDSNWAHYMSCSRYPYAFGLQDDPEADTHEAVSNRDFERPDVFDDEGGMVSDTDCSGPHGCGAKANEYCDLEAHGFDVVVDDAELIAKSTCAVCSAKPGRVCDWDKHDERKAAFNAENHVWAALVGRKDETR